MNEREWRERFESTRYDDDDDWEDEDAENEPSVPDPEELWDEEGRPRRRSRWVPIIYYVRRGTPAPGGE